MRKRKKKLHNTLKLLGHAQKKLPSSITMIESA